MKTSNKLTQRYTEQECITRAMFFMRSAFKAQTDAAIDMRASAAATWFGHAAIARKFGCIYC